MSGKTTVLLAGVDTLILNVKQKGEDGQPKKIQTLPFDVGEHLDIWQKEAKVKEEPYVTSWEHEKVSFENVAYGCSWVDVVTEKWTVSI